MSECWVCEMGWQTFLANCEAGLSQPICDAHHAEFDERWSNRRDPVFAKKAAGLRRVAIDLETSLADRGYPGTDTLLVMRAISCLRTAADELESATP